MLARIAHTLGTPRLVAPASVYAEIVVGPYRAGPEAVSEVEAFISNFGIQIEPISASIARIAPRLRSERNTLRLPDALIFACADEIEPSSPATSHGRS